MAHTMHHLFLQEACLGAADSSGHEDDTGWLALETVIDNWPGWLNPVEPDQSDAAARNMSRPTSPSLAPLHPAPVLLHVAPIAESLTPSAAPATANPSCHAASKGEKRLRPRELTMVLRSWMERCPRAPYASLEEKKMAAGALSIPVEQVTNFCNNYRKRFLKVGTKLTSYRELVAASP